MHRHLIAVIIFSLATSAGAESIVGWRTDGTGRYPEAEIVTQWGQGRNVIWQTSLSATSNASPVLVADRLFVCAEPATLICMNAKSGQVLWKADNSYEAVLGDEQKAQMLAGANQSAEQAKKTLAQVNTEIKSIEASANPDNRRLRQLKRQRGQLEAQSRAAAEISLPRTHNTNGYASPTPVSDGKFIYVTFGTGIAAKYDLQGNRKWAKFIAKPSHGWGHSASPSLAGGRLVVHLGSLRGLNVENGEEVWNVPAREHWGSPLAAKVGDTDVVFTTDGQAVRGVDGKVLATGMGTLAYATPVVQDGVVYYIEGKASAYKLPDSVDDSLKVERLWVQSIKGSRHYASPVIHEGLVYCISREETYTVLDAATGSIVHEERDMLGNSGSTNSAYPSIVLAGSHLIVSNEKGTMFVIKPGKTHEVIARNQIEGFRASPVCADGRMYVRTFSKMYCFGKGG